ncbi:MAG TPA: hypothetical protein VF316_10965 [Polyangiaceae bacterium]
MTSSKGRLVALALGVAMAASAPTVASAAGPTAQDLETARTLYKEGKDLRAKGDLKGALAKLLAAHSLGHTPLTGIELARVEVELGMFVEARETCLGVARMPVEADETARSAEARAEAATVADKLKPRIPSLRINIIGVDADAALIVMVDRERVPVAALSEARKMNPGHHEISAQIEGGKAVSTPVDLKEAEAREVTLSPPPAPKAPPPPPPPGTPEERHGLSSIAIAGLVMTGVGLGVGAIGGIAALTKKNELDTTCANDACLPAQWDTIDSAKTWATVSNIGFIFAGVGGAVTVIGVLMGPSKAKREAYVVPDIGAGWVGVHGGF